jgi:flagellin FlaB
MLKKIPKRERGITGLETAIILIAFVVVAAVFAYTVLTAGLFSTQKSQEAVYSGLKEAQSTLELKGSVIATANNTGEDGNIQYISFVVSNALNGKPIDFTPPTANTTYTGLASANSTNSVVISYIDDEQEVNDLYWTITKLGNADDDNMLEQGEKFQVIIGDNTSAGNLIHALTPDLTVDKTFSIVVLTPAGAVLTIERTIPGNIDPINNLR